MLSRKYTVLSKSEQHFYSGEGERERERERKSVCVCVCMSERESCAGERPNQ